jgi:uncharacterized peroxidase-related enzyme
MAQTIRGADPALDPTLAEVEQKAGPSNFLRLIALRPETLQPFLALYKSIMGTGTLDRRLKEMVYVAVSSVNECTYCGTHHEKAARTAGLSESEIREILTESNHHFTLKEQAALQFARSLTRNADVDEDVRLRMQDLFSNDQIVELTTVVCLANFTNRFSNGLAVPLES